MIRREFEDLEPLEKIMACIAIAGVPFSFSFILKMAGLDGKFSKEELEGLIAELDNYGLKKEYGYRPEDFCYIFDIETKVKVLQTLNVDIISVFNAAEGYIMNRWRTNELNTHRELWEKIS